MKVIPLDQVQIAANRQRKTFDLKSLVELGESIVRNGLFHPIVLREEFESDSHEASGEPPHLILVSGERRLRAIKDLSELGSTFKHDSEEVPAGTIPYTTLGELDELAREEAEAEENLCRLNLTWQEQASATARIARIKSLRAAASGSPAPTTAAIALEVRGSSEGSNQETTRREIIVAAHLSDPEVAAAKSVDEGFKILRRKEDTAKRVQLAADIGRTYSADTAHRVLNEDSLSWMKFALPEIFDVICTDPPYGISADEFGDSGGHAAGPHSYKDDYDTWLQIIQTLAQEGIRITKPQAHLYCFCDITRFEEAKEIFSAAGWKCFRTPIIWHKPNGNRLPWVTSGPQRKYELILYAKKGDKPVTRIYPDLVTYTADENEGHNAQKPVALYLDLLRRSVSPGDSVLDPFAGSGPLLPAAQELKCKATAIELDPAAYAICIGRLKRLGEEPELTGLV